MIFIKKNVFQNIACKMSATLLGVDKLNHDLDR